MDDDLQTRAAWVPCADGLRATAAVLVFFQHAAFLTAAVFHSRAGGVLARFDVAPTIFFALSGFLLAQPYLGAIFDGRPLPSLRTYCRRRVVRIVPAYWVALTATYVWLRPESAVRADWTDRVLHYLLLQIYPDDTFPKGISAAWTLAVEATFYASLPFLAMAAVWLVRRQPTVSRRALLLLGALALASVGSLVYRTLLHARGGPFQALLWLPGTFIEFAIGLSAAVLGGWAARRPVARALTDFLGRRDLLWWVVAALLLVFQGTQLRLARGIDHASWDRELFGEIVRVAIATCLLIPVAFGPPGRGLVRRFLRSWPVASLGVISYGFFLWHVPLIEVALRLTDQPMFLDWSKGIGLLSADVLEPVGLAFALSVVAGTASWFLVERPLLGNRRARKLAAPEHAAP
jgi:peptidoglycan/LPS O-acetylase OafA/YrhL